MADNADPKTPIETIPSVQGGYSAVASAHAPFFYFDNAPAFGHLNGIIRITLEASRDMPSGDGLVSSDHVIVAHLRMNMAAALSLKGAIDGALLLASPPPTQAQN